MKDWLFHKGYYDVGKIRGARVRVHWSLPVAALVWSGFTFDPIGWVGFLALVMLHELGHAALVWRIGDEVISIQLHAFGGSCAWAGNPTRAERSFVAWGGVLAQGALWLVATLVLLIYEPTSGPLRAIAYIVTTENLRLALFNLLPFPPFDGYEAWKLFPILWAGRSELGDYLRDRDERRRKQDRENASAKRWEQKKDATKQTVDEILKDLETQGDDPGVPSEVQRVLDKILGENKRKPRD